MLDIKGKCTCDERGERIENLLAELICAIHEQSRSISALAASVVSDAGYNDEERQTYLSGALRG